MATSGRPPHDHDHAGHDHAAHDHADHDHAAHDHADHDHAGHDHGGHDHGGHDHGGHGHHHAHLAAAGAEGERRVRLLLGLQVTYLLVEVAGGLWSGSLALLADAGHMTTDAAAMVVVLFAIRLARRPASPQRTWGYHRAEIIGATVNGAALLAVAAGVLWEAWERLGQPHAIAGGPMFAIASGGLVVNLLGLWLLGAVRKDDLNLRAAWMHALSDAAGSVAAMIAGVCVWAWGWTLADSIASVLLAALVLRGAWMLLDDSLDVLMEGAPAHIDVTAVRAALRATPGVLDVHDLHVWTIASGQVAMSGHVVTASECPSAPLLRAVQERLRAQFGISHATIQVEPPGFEEVGIHP